MYSLQIVFSIFFITLAMVGGIKLHDKICKSFYKRPTYFRAITKGLHKTKSHKSRAFSKNALFFVSVKITNDSKSKTHIESSTLKSHIDLKFNGKLSNVKNK